MPALELRLDGHSTGLACALAERMQGELPFAAFKMAHPLEVRASVIMESEEDEAREACVNACESIAADLSAMTRHLPPDPCAKQRLWSERQTTWPDLPMASFIKLSSDADDVRIRAASAVLCAQRQDNTKGSVHHAIGRFEVDFQMTSMQRRILERLVPIYTDDICEDVLRPVLEQHEGWPSIRLIDWALTNFAKSRRVFCMQQNGQRINVFLAYKTQLSFFRRRNFDAFRRRLRIKICSPGGDMFSTIAQLNFYAWAHETGILQWCRANASEVEEHMNTAVRQRTTRKPGQRRRSELSSAPRAKVAIYECSSDHGCS